MPQYFIIDRSRNLHRLEAPTKAGAIDKFNDASAIKADYTVEAIPCVHPKLFISPELPCWMEFYPTGGCNICFRCSEPKEPEEVVIVEKPESLFFRHLTKVV